MNIMTKEQAKEILRRAESDLRMANVVLEMHENDVDVRRCCHIGCKSKATHSIYYSKGYEDYSDFCGKHLHQYLPINYNVNVSPIMSDGYNA